MAHQSLYRKYRSQTFDDLIGQGHVVRTLQNAIASGRIGHAYLFTGPRGTGKTSTARLLAKALCATDGPTPTPSDDDPICKAIADGNFVDVVEMDAASESGVEDIRTQIVDVAEYRPMIARYKVFIIDEVHDLSMKAFDALLKTIEEPPDHLIFILATTEFNKVPPTIRSRCQKYEFHRASMSDLTDRLDYVLRGENVQAQPAAVAAIARMADGGYRDALTLLEQAILTTEDGKITLTQVYDQLGLVPEETIDRLLLSIRESDVPAIMETLGEIARLGRDPRAVLDSAMHRMSDLTRAAYQVPTGQNDGAREASLYETAQRLGRDYLLRLRGQLAEAHKALRDITLPRLWLEAELIRLATQTAVVPVMATVAPTPTAPEPIRRRTLPDETPRVTAPTPEPIKAPEAQPAVEIQTPEPVAPLRTSEGDPQWDLVLAKVPSTAAMGMKLKKSRLVETNDDLWKVALTHMTFVDWFTDDPKRQRHINKLASDAVGKPVRVVFMAHPKGVSVAEDDGAVELPVEGERLEQLAREIFDVPRGDAGNEAS